MEKVGGKAGHDRAILRLQFIVSLSITLDWKIERGCFPDDGGVLAEFCVSPVNIAVSTASTAFGAAMPWIPEWHRRPPFRVGCSGLEVYVILGTKRSVPLGEYFRRNRAGIRHIHFICKAV